jgi:hypothetical protein
MVGFEGVTGMGRWPLEVLHRLEFFLLPGNEVPTNDSLFGVLPS